MQLGFSESPDDYVLMQPLAGPKPHFLRPPKCLGGEPRTLQVFNNLAPPRPVAFISPAGFVAPPQHFMAANKAPGSLIHVMPKGLPSVIYRVLQATMDWQRLADPNLSRKVGIMELLVHTAMPEQPAHPGHDSFRPARVHFDDSRQHFAREIGEVSSNFGWVSAIPTQHVPVALLRDKTESKLGAFIEDINANRVSVEYQTFPAGTLVAWSGAHPHRAGLNTTPHPISRAFLWQRYGGAERGSRAAMLMASHPWLSTGRLPKSLPLPQVSL